MDVNSGWTAEDGSGPETGFNSMTYYYQWAAWKKYATWKTVGCGALLAAVGYLVLRH